MYKKSLTLFINPVIFLMVASLYTTAVIGQETKAKNENSNTKFEQLGAALPTPNQYRLGSGAPGSLYWQQKVDYKMSVSINDATQELVGKEKITYTNNSPDTLLYLWVQLDQNVRKKGSISMKAKDSEIIMNRALNTKTLKEQLNNYDGGYKIISVKNARKKPMKYVINNTMMRIDLAEPLAPKSSFEFLIEWSYIIYDRMFIDGRGGFEYFPDSDDRSYTIAQFYPRMAVYDDVNGWQNKQFLGSGEFALEFGDFDVSITVPSDHLVAATGMLQNPKKVLNKKQLKQYHLAQRSYDKIVMIQPETAAIALEKSEKSKSKKTWHFKATNVRDFGFASSRKFIWDAIAVKIGNRTAMAYSFYPKEGNPLWEKESTKAVKNTLEYYSKMTIPYPYPHATSVHTAWQGMEYPMICYNYGRPEKGKYSDRLKDAMISVIIHEVGHNFFPMIVNSDERQWTWMDEGLNTFLEKETKRVKYAGVSGINYAWGTPAAVAGYMAMSKTDSRPIMANSENILHFGYNAYGKPAAALTALREVVMGPELFDYAFKEYAKRWAFKRPMPADFFRSMEDASAVDLDWFWKGWFYTVDYVDLSIESVQWYKFSDTKLRPETFKSLEKQTNNKDFSAGPTTLNIIKTDHRLYGEFKSKIDDAAVLKNLADKNIYELEIKNVGGLITPIIIEWTYKDGSKEIEKLPAEIWRKNNTLITKSFLKSKEVAHIQIDPKEVTGDIDGANNIFPKTKGSDFDTFKEGN